MSVANPTGTETYSRRIVRSLLATHRSESIRIYGRGDLPTDLINREDDATRPLPARRLWTHVHLSREMLLHRPDVLFVPAHVIPLIHPPSVVTIHDLGYVHVPEMHPHGQRFMLDRSTRWSARSAVRVITPSAFTRNDLVERLGVDADRIDVIPHGVDLPPAIPATQLERVRERFCIARPYVLAVGTIQPRKNYGLLARAVAIAVSRGLDIDLVIAGRPGWQLAQVQHDIDRSGIGTHLRMVSYVEPEDLPALFAGASMFAQPSLFEGFGMPMLEAMAAGVPVIASDSSSLPEVGGDAALYVDRHDPDDLANALRRIMDDSALAGQMRSAGRMRAASFTWARAAQETLISIRRATNG